MYLIEKSINDEGYYVISLNGQTMFTASSNESIKAMGELLLQLSEAGDYTTMVVP